MNGEPLRLRPHHGICLRFFNGKGYDTAFVKNMACVADSLKMNPERQVMLLCGVDALCISCPHNCGGECDSEKPARYDSAVLSLCGLQDGELLPWRDFQRLVLEKILAPGKRETVCGDCVWTQICPARE